MVKVSIVKKATVEVIKPHELKVGDEILWANKKCKVLFIHYSNPKVFATINEVPDEDATLTIPRYMYYYRIIECETEEEEI